MMLWNADRSKVATVSGALLIALAASVAATLGARTDNSLQSMLAQDAPSQVATTAPSRKIAPPAFLAP